MDTWTERLSEYLDGEMDPVERVRLERHLQGCAECGATLAELRRVVERAEALADRPPTGDLWPGIATRLDPREAAGVLPLRRERRRVWSVPQLAAAGVALMLGTAGATWWLARGGAAPSAPAVAVNPAPARATLPGVAAPPGSPLVRVASATAAATRSYDAAIGDLEQVLRQGRGRLDPKTLAAIQQSLSAVDSALAQAQRALAADPASAYLNEYLAQTLQHKLDLLRQATSLVATPS